MSLVWGRTYKGLTLFRWLMLVQIIPYLCGLRSCRSADGFAEVYPEHKYLIVKSLRKLGFRCGGDGVNDAPALKRANVGLRFKAQQMPPEQQRTLS